MLIKCRKYLSFWKHHDKFLCSLIRLLHCMNMLRPIRNMRWCIAAACCVLHLESIYGPWDDMHFDTAIVCTTFDIRVGDQWGVDCHWCTFLYSKREIHQDLSTLYKTLQLFYFHKFLCFFTFCLLTRLAEIVRGAGSITMLSITPILLMMSLSPVSLAFKLNLKGMQWSHGHSSITQIRFIRIQGSWSRN